MESSRDKPIIYEPEELKQLNSIDLLDYKNGISDEDAKMMSPPSAPTINLGSMTTTLGTTVVGNLVTESPVMEEIPAVFELQRLKITAEPNSKVSVRSLVVDGMNVIFQLQKLEEFAKNGTTALASVDLSSWTFQVGSGYADFAQLISAPYVKMVGTGVFGADEHPITVEASFFVAEIESENAEDKFNN